MILSQMLLFFLFFSFFVYSRSHLCLIVLSGWPELQLVCKGGDTHSTTGGGLLVCHSDRPTDGRTNEPTDRLTTPAASGGTDKVLDFGLAPVPPWVLQKGPR